MKRLSIERFRWAAFLSILLLSIVIIPEVNSDTIPVATSEVGSQASSKNITLIGPLPVGLSANDQYNYTGGEGTNYPVSVETTASVTTSLSGNSILNTVYSVGNLSGDGFANISGYLGEGAQASSGGNIIFYAYIFPKVGVTLPSELLENYTVPVSISASGSVSVASGGLWAGGNAFVDVYTAIGGFDPAKFSAGVANGSNSFDQSATIWLIPGAFQQFSMSGSGSAWAEGSYSGGSLGGSPISSQASYSFAVDPTFMLDQAAFDAFYGVNSFPLKEYFEIGFSPNMEIAQSAPVPEPSTMVLLGSGLVGLIGYGRRRARK